GLRLLLLGRGLDQRLPQLLLRRERVGEVAAELGANLLDDLEALLRVGRGAVRGRGRAVRGEDEEPDRESEQPAPHASMCLRKLSRDDPEPRARPAPNTMPAAIAAMAVVTPGANCVKELEPPTIPAIARTNVTPPATAPARAPGIAPSTKNGPRTIQCGA